MTVKELMVILDRMDDDYEVRIGTGGAGCFEAVEYVERAEQGDTQSDWLTESEALQLEDKTTFSPTAVLIYNS